MATVKIILLGLSFFLWGFNSSVHAQADIHLQVPNISTVKGKLYIAIYDKKEGFRSPKKAYQLRIIDIEHTSISTTFHRFPEGDYAITLFQDLNNNGMLDVNWAGIPKEPYGFSNNPVIRFGPPSFKDTKISIKNEHSSISIKMK